MVALKNQKSEGKFFAWEIGEIRQAGSNIMCRVGEKNHGGISTERVCAMLMQKQKEFTVKMITICDV